MGFRILERVVWLVVVVGTWHWGLSFDGFTAPKCRQLALPPGPPSVDVFVDSVALMRQLLVADTGTVGELVVAIRNGEKATGHFVDDSVPALAKDSLVARVVASLRALSKDAPPAFRVRVVRGAEPGIGLEHSVLCEPEFLQEESLKARAGIGQLRIDGNGPRPGPGSGRVQANMRIGRNGNVLEVILDGTSGAAEADRFMRDSFATYRYKPALLDGEPVEVWLKEGRIDIVR